MKAALIGAGRVADRHLRALDGIDRVDLTAVCDLDEERASAAAAPRNASVYTDHVALLDSEVPDFVYLLTPQFARREPAIAAAERGIHLFVEKPAAATLEDAHAIHAAVQENDVVTHSGYDLRYAEIVDRARELIDDRTIGYVEGHHWGSVPDDGWKRRRETFGSYATHFAGHTIDLVRYLAGDVAELTAFGDNRIVPRDVIEYEDVGAATMRHENGVLSQLSFAAFKRAGHAVRLLGDGFDLHLDLGSENALSGDVDGEEVSATGASRFHERKRWERMATAFVGAIDGTNVDRIRTDYGDMVRTFELTRSIEDAYDGRLVQPG